MKKQSVGVKKDLALAVWRGKGEMFEKNATKKGTALLREKHGPALREKKSLSAIGHEGQKERWKIFSILGINSSCKEEVRIWGEGRSWTSVAEIHEIRDPKD